MLYYNLLILLQTLLLGESANMGASSAGSSGGTPDRNRPKFDVGGTTDQGTSPGPDEPDAQIHGTGMFSDSIMNSILPAANAKVMPSMTDRWHLHSSR